MKSESVNEFFGARSPHQQVDKQFNVFDREAYAIKPMHYSRRDFYKITLMQGTSLLHYADKTVKIDQPALTFSNPLVPYSWESISEEQPGYFCIFSEDFLKVKDKDLILQESPLFKIGADPIFFINDEQLEYLTGIFRNMVREFASAYIYKYDLLRNHVNLILHEALKMQPSLSYI